MGGFEEYSVLLVVGLRNILLPIVVVLLCCFVVLFCCFVGGLLDVNFDKDRRGGWMQGGGKSRGCIRINLILLILYNYSRTPFYRLLRHE